LPAASSSARRAGRTQTSVLAGIIFHKSRMPLSKWFLAIHLITRAFPHLMESWGIPKSVGF
jgi:hypothetical protein